MERTARTMSSQGILFERCVPSQFSIQHMELVTPCSSGVYSAPFNCSAKQIIDVLSQRLASSSFSVREETKPWNYRRAVTGTPYPVHRVSSMSSVDTTKSARPHHTI